MERRTNTISILADAPGRRSVGGNFSYRRGEGATQYGRFYYADRTPLRLYQRWFISPVSTFNKGVRSYVTCV